MGERRHNNNWPYAWPAGPLLEGLPDMGFLLSVSPSFQDNSAILCCTYKQVERAVRGVVKVKEIERLSAKIQMRNVLKKVVLPIFCESWA